MSLQAKTGAGRADDPARHDPNGEPSAAKSRAGALSETAEAHGRFEIRTAQSNLYARKNDFFETPDQSIVIPWPTLTRLDLLTLARPKGADPGQAEVHPRYNATGNTNLDPVGRNARICGQESIPNEAVVFRHQHPR